MTQTLTTERQQFEEYFNIFYGCRPTDHHDPIHVEWIWHAWQDGNTRAANREAQPVWVDAEVHEAIQDILQGRMSGAGRYVTLKRNQAPNGFKQRMPLYTAPSAPAVPEEKAPKDFLFRTNANYQAAVYVAEGWNACRAAMLAAAPEGGKCIDSKEL